MEVDTSLDTQVKEETRKVLFGLVMVEQANIVMHMKEVTSKFILGANNQLRAGEGGNDNDL